MSGTVCVSQGSHGRRNGSWKGNKGSWDREPPIAPLTRYANPPTEDALPHTPPLDRNQRPGKADRCCTQIWCVGGRLIHHSEFLLSRDTPLWLRWRCVLLRSKTRYKFGAHKFCTGNYKTGARACKAQFSSPFLVKVPTSPP